jgi:hypothetical protein
MMLDNNPKISIPNFYEYLEKFHQTCTEKLSDKELDSYRKQFETYRNKLYKQRQRQLSRELTLFLSEDEYNSLQNASKTHKMTLSAYVKQSSLKYTTSTYIVPDRAILVKLIAQLRDIQKNIYQIANRKRNILTIKDFDYPKLQGMFQEMQNGLLGNLTQPINADQWILNELKNNHAFKRKLIEILLTNL